MAIRTPPVFRLLLLPLLLLLAVPAWAGQKQALVIGNGAYADARLKNPANDARDIAAKLRSLDFKVTELIDADQRQMENAVRDFTRALGQGSVGLFYFAGHGIEVGGENYLVPVGADIQVEEDVHYKALPAGRVLAGMRGAGNPMNLVILDACRNNPYARSFRSAGRGLARMNAAEGALVLYAAQPGQVAQDGEGRNGLFTGQLLAALDEPGLKVEEVIKRTALAVRDASGSKQTPWQEGVMLGDFYFREPAQRTDDPLAGERLALIREREKIGEERRRLQSEAAQSKPKPPEPPSSEGKGYREPKSGMEFVRIEGGEFQMGSPAGEKGRESDEKQHRVSVDGFYMGKHEVTNGQYRRFKPGHDSGKGFNEDTQPVVEVDWHDASAYAEWLSQETGKSYRLPTEAEWEYACRAGGQDRYCGGNDLDALAWYSSNSGSGTHAVGGKKASAWGLHDMSGNVWEWTCSAYGKGYGGDEKQCPSKNDATVWRVARGGSWKFKPGYVRSANRDGSVTSIRGDLTGFRLARTLSP